ALSTQQVAGHMLRGEVHGPWLMLGQNPKAAKQEKKKMGWAKRYMQYNQSFVNIVPNFGKKKGPKANSQVLCNPGFL
ncbi:hypothetical protein FD754_003540, partial [Muntiacus muntjak]